VANAVFYHKPDSKYDDSFDSYHFPSQYLSRVKKVVGDYMTYYGPISGKSGRFYTGLGKVVSVRPDLTLSDHYYADIEGFLDFDEPVHYQLNGGFEHKLFSVGGSINSGRAVQAVRLIERSEFEAIIEAGLSKADEWPDRVDTHVPYSSSDMSQIMGFGEEPQPEIIRPVSQLILNRPFRDAKFKQHVRVVYDRTCAFTGLRLINGKGRPEVEAAHIKPVEHNGPDSIRNGIALSGTVHWMFDRGLLSLADDFTILKSRHLNHDVNHLLRPDLKAIVPLDSKLQPHPHYLNWHRTNCFKN
jgi:putative restriction endonuclease